MHIEEDEQGWSDNSSQASSNDELPVVNKNKRKNVIASKSTMKKIKYEAINHEQVSKKSKNDLYKAPTVEELNELKETENLYNNNLFRLQIDELIKEVKIKNKHVNNFNSWYQKFEIFIKELPNYKIKPAKVKETTIRCDQILDLNFTKPVLCTLFGLQKISAFPGPVLRVNINLNMPRSVFNVKDYLNNRYFAKRYFYLVYILHFLKKKNLGANIKWVNHESNNFLPILQCNPENDEKVVIQIFATPPENYFKTSRFLPQVNNVKMNYLDNTQLEDELLKESPTPLYNASMAHDVALAINQDFIEKSLKELGNVQEAIKLIRVWLAQRHLNDGLGAFSDSIITYFIAYLVAKKRINKHMSSYQVVRNFWSFIKDADLAENGISLSEDVKLDDMEAFKRHFDVVFIDRSGCCNVLAFVHLEFYRKIQYECEIAFKLLEENGINSFHYLFISKLPVHLQYDFFLSIKTSNKLEKIAKSAQKEDQMRYLGLERLLLIKKLTALLKQGLNKRALNIVPIPCNTELLFGVTLDPNHAFHFLEMGPALNDPKEKDFREFWGPMSSDRRFKDGSICVAVYFETKTIHGRRGIINEIIDWVIGSKLCLKYKLYFNNFEDLIIDKNAICSYAMGTNEEGCLKVIAASDDLAKKLRALEMPLTITSVQGTSDVFCFTEVFPPIATNYEVGKTISAHSEYSLMLNKTLKTVPKYVAPIECVLQLEHSSKWPKDLEGIRSMITAFYLEIAKMLKQKHRILSSVKSDFIDVFYEGFLFRYKLYLAREIGFLKKESTENDVIVYKESIESKEMEKKLVIEPKLTGALKGVHSQFPSYGPSTALIKRWLRAHLIDDYLFPDVVINLLNASLYLNQTSFGAALTPQVGFLRFLKFISELPYQVQPVLVNFNDEITKRELAEIDSKMSKSRNSCPTLYLAVPYDNCQSLFTKAAPTNEVLRRVKQLAVGTLKCMDNVVSNDTAINFQSLFFPNLEGYNVVIYLKRSLNPLRHQQINDTDVIRVNFDAYDASKNTRVPITGFNPVQKYLQELREYYSQFATFFHDSYGGNVIGVLWTPKTSQLDEFKVYKVGGKKLVDGKLVTNIDAIIQDFYALGKDLVKSIDKK